jgi:hypothetical protein
MHNHISIIYQIGFPILWNLSFAMVGGPNNDATGVLQLSRQNSNIDLSRREDDAVVVVLSTTLYGKFAIFI